MKTKVKKHELKPPRQDDSVVVLKRRHASFDHHYGSGDIDDDVVIVVPDTAAATTTRPTNHPKVTATAAATSVSLYKLHSEKEQVGEMVFRHPCRTYDVYFAARPSETDISYAFEAWKTFARQSDRTISGWKLSIVNLDVDTIVDLANCGREAIIIPANSEQIIERSSVSGQDEATN